MTTHMRTKQKIRHSPVRQARRSHKRGPEREASRPAATRVARESRLSLATMASLFGGQRRSVTEVAPESPWRKSDVKTEDLLAGS